MLKVKDKQFWKDCRNCFTSVPQSNRDKVEHWFNPDEHTHDIGAVAHDWKYILPWRFKTSTNELVNLDLDVADERGIFSL